MKFWLVCVSSTLRSAMVVALALVLTSIALGQETIVRLAPSSYRADAVNAPMPVFSLDSIAKRHQGLAVVNVLVNSDGTLRSSEVVDAPDHNLALSVDQAIRRWKFRPFLVDGKPVAVRSVFVFYFRLQGDHPTVVDAALQAREQGFEQHH